MPSLSEPFFSRLQSNQINGALNSLELYRLPMSEQRIYHFMLLHSQRSQVIKIGGIKPLNMETCLNVSNNHFDHELLTTVLIFCAFNCIADFEICLHIRHDCLDHNVRGISLITGTRTRKISLLINLLNQ